MKLWRLRKKKEGSDNFSREKWTEILPTDRDIKREMLPHFSADGNFGVLNTNTSCTRHI